MADPQKYDRAAAFEMLQKEHGEYVSPDQINKELDSYEKANGLGAPVEQTAPVTGSAPPPLTAQDKSIAAQAENYALVPSTARETVNTITAPPVGSTSLPDVASAAWGNLSTPEKYAVGGGAAALGSLVTYGAKKLVDRFLISDKQAVPPIDRTRDISMSDTKPPPPPPPPPEGPKLSAVDQQIMDRQAINRQVREDYLNRTVGGTPTPEVVAQTPEEIKIAKQAAAAQAVQQSMAATPPQGTTLQPVVPVANVAPEPVTGVPVEPVATPAAEPVATTTETPTATDAERVQAIQATEEPKAKVVTATEAPPPLTKKEQTKLDKSLLAGKNQYENQLGAKSFPEQFKKSWDVLTEHVFSEGPPKGQGGSPQYWEKAQAFMKANPDKFPSETLKHIKQLAEKYGKPTDQSGFARLGSMAGLGSTALAGLLVAPSIMAAKKSAQEGDIGMAASHASNVLNLHPFGMLGNMLFGTSPEELQTLRENDKARKAKVGNAATSRK